ncbi:MAG: S41 family peptidase [Alistipes sp.]|nr:S41 family peptidase [Alistipes sp.]
MRYLVVVILSLATFAMSASAQLTKEQQIQKLNLVYHHIRNTYIDDISFEPLVDEAIKATLKELDPHSQYLTQEQMKVFRERLRGEFAGIGIRYIMHNDTLVVRSVIQDSPASRAGIMPNDRVVSIDGQGVVGISADSAQLLMQGEVGSKITIQTLRRGEDRPRNINIKRDYVESSAIGTSYRVGEVGYIYITAFSKPIASEVYSAYKDLGDIKSLIIDLRDNGGGALTSAIDLSSMFLAKGDVIVSTEGKDGSDISYIKRGQIDIATPLVVIINENSASASEIFAGAIQDHDRGVIIGHTSYGKGLIQKVYDLKDGSGLLLTTSRYKTPSGRIIQRPYSMGRGEEYKRDPMRYTHPDSIAQNPELMYTTLKLGRKVYGGGGITPDIYLDPHQVEVSPKLSKLYIEGLFEHLAIEIGDRVSHQSMLTQYPTIDDFVNSYELDDELMELFYSYSNSTESDFTQSDIEFIRTMLNASIAEWLYGLWARYYIYNESYDYTLQQALKVANDPNTYGTILSCEDK